MVLTKFPYDPLLDLAPWVGQRQCTYQFQLLNGTSGENKGNITPIRGSATLTHDTSRTIKRQLMLGLGVQDTALVDPVKDRIVVTMVFPAGQTYPLGRYMFTDESFQVFTSGELANVVLNDEMYLVDQAITQGFDGYTSALSNTSAAGTAFETPAGFSITTMVQALFDSLPVQIEIEASPFTSIQSWGIGTRRGQIVEDLALTGDYFSPWFGNDTHMHWIRSFNPATEVPDFDWDAGNQVMRASILRSTNILNAPNRFVVISNTPSNKNEPTFATVDVPPNSPHSLENRGFIIADVRDISSLTTAQCAAIAQNLAERQMIFETTTLTTAPDPRHDSYNVIKWQGSQWLELGWTMPLAEGAPMSHTLRRSYR
jgi:hypothetical protein